MAALVVVAVIAALTAAPAHGQCAQRRASAAYTARVDRALSAKRDVWGERLIAAPGGPTFAAANRYLAPLLLARTSGGRPLTDSGVYYLPFAEPSGPQGGGTVALHVADGGEILWNHVSGRRLTIDVGPYGRERYGSCLARLSTPALAGGYLPILETHYVDASGVRYRQESFATRAAGTEPLTSFVRLTADAGRARAGTTRLHFAASGGGALAYPVPAGGARTVYIAWRPQGPPRQVEEAAYAAARAAAEAYWRRRLAEGTTFVVPEKRVLDAERALLVQNLMLTWRYSVGNPYQEFSYPESIDTAEVMGEYGFGAVASAILRTSLGRRPTPYPNWKMGEKLLGSAEYYRLFRDARYVEDVTPALRGYVDALARQIDGSGSGLLGRERYSSDIGDSVYGFHSQAVVWQALQTIASVWAQTGERTFAALCRSLAARLETSLRRAVRESQRWLPDRSLFIPARLLDDEAPFDSLPDSVGGSYWNLVTPYALASGLFAPGTAQARGVLRYLELHGSRLLGLVRAGSFALYRGTPGTGTDEVYGLNLARFLAANDQTDELVLALYGQLAAAMTPNTFVAGEGATVGPLRGAYYRAMYLPPNATSNASFLETLRLMLIHETANKNGTPTGLELAYATPRAWLRAGQRILVRAAPTSFGPITFSIDAAAGSAHVRLTVPNRPAPPSLRLRLRAPGGRPITSVSLDGHAWRRFNGADETIDLSGAKGSLSLLIRYGR